MRGFIWTVATARLLRECFVPFIISLLQLVSTSWSRAERFNLAKQPAVTRGLLWTLGRRANCAFPSRAINTWCSLDLGRRYDTRR